MKKFIFTILCLVCALFFSIETTKISANEEFAELNMTITINGVNVARDAGMVVYYDKRGYKNGRSPANSWGYEVAVNSDGYVEEVAANVNGITDGFILSAHGDAKNKLMQLKIGDKIVVNQDYTQAIITRTYQESMFARSKINYDKANALYQVISTIYIDCDNSVIDQLMIDIDKSYQVVLGLKDQTNLGADDRQKLSDNQEIISNSYMQMFYMSSQTSNVDLRGLWHRPLNSAIDESTLDGVKAFLQRVKMCGFNTIFLETYWDGYFTGKSQTVETHPRVRGLDMGEYGDDYLKAFITEANKIGIEVHAWCHTFNAGGKAYISNQIKQEWLLETYTGEKLHPNEYGGAYYLDPSNDEVIEYMANMYKDILTNYAFDGLQLDYIRYWDNNFSVFPYRDSGYGELSEAKFLEATGLSGDVKNIVKSTVGRAAWNAWRCTNITNAVKKLSGAVKSIDKDLVVSAAVVSNPTEAKATYMQDLHEWAENGYIDLFCPMIYTGSVEAIKTYSIALKNTVNSMAYVSSGIAPLYYGYSNQINHEQMESGIVNSIGTSYFASQNIFYTANEPSETEKIIKMGVYRNEAINPLTSEVSDVMDIYYNDLSSIINKASSRDKLSSSNQMLLQSFIDQASAVYPNNPNDYTKIIDFLNVLKKYSALIDDTNAQNTMNNLVDEITSYLEIKINRYLINNGYWDPSSEEKPDISEIDFPLIEEQPDDKDDDVDKVEDKGCKQNFFNIIYSMISIFAIILIIRKFKH